MRHGKIGKDQGVSFRRPERTCGATRVEPNPKYRARGAADSDERSFAVNFRTLPCTRSRITDRKAKQYRTSLFTTARPPQDR
jgi:hypothetical protein